MQNINDVFYKLYWQKIFEYITTTHNKIISEYYMDILRKNVLKKRDVNFSRNKRKFSK